MEPVGAARSGKPLLGLLWTACLGAGHILIATELNGEINGANQIPKLSIRKLFQGTSERARWVKVSATEARPPELDPWNPCKGGRRVGTPQSCPLTSQAPGLKHPFIHSHRETITKVKETLCQECPPLTWRTRLSIVLPRARRRSPLSSSQSTPSGAPWVPLSIFSCVCVWQKPSFHPL